MANADFSIYTLGDTDMFVGMLNGIALVFQDPLFSSNSVFGLGYGAFLGALFLLVITIYQSAFSKKFELKMLIGPLILYILLTLPKVPVTVIDVFNQESPQQVANIPIGLAFPLSVASGVAASFSTSMETAYSTTSSPRMLTSGFASPLRDLYALRYTNLSADSPRISELINSIYSQCIANNRMFDASEYMNAPDSYRYFINFALTKTSGIVAVRDLDNSPKIVSCPQAADMLMREFEAYVYGDGTVNGSLSYNFKKSLNNALLLSPDAAKFKKTKDYTDVLTSFSQITDLKDSDARQFLLNTIFNQPLQSASFCENNKYSNRDSDAQLGSCLSWIQSNEQLSEDNAAAATGFVQMMQNGQNLLIILAILLFPMVVLVIMYLGLKSLPIVSSYIMYICSVYLWLPMATIVNFFIYSKIRNTAFLFQSEDGSGIALADYPLFFSAISDALSLANGITAFLPLFCIMFFAGMTMAMVGFMRRMDSSKGQYFDTKVNAPDYVNPSSFINRKSSFNTTGLGAVTDTMGGMAFTASSSKTFMATASELMSLQQQKQKLFSENKSLTALLSNKSTVGTSGENGSEEQSNVRGSSHNNASGKGFSDDYKSTHTVQQSGRVETDEGEIKNRNAFGLTNLSGSEYRAGVGLKFGRGNALPDTVIGLNDDGSILPNGTGPQSTLQNKAKGLDLKFIQFEAGASQIADSKLINTYAKDKTDSNKVGLFQGSESSELSLSSQDHNINSDKTKKILDGDGTSANKSTGITNNTEDALDKSYAEQISRAISQNTSEIKAIDEKIASITSSGLVVSMMDSDILHRISRHEGIRSDLESIDEKNKKLYGDQWENIKKSVSEMADLTGLQITKAVNPNEYRYFEIAMAGFQLNSETLAESYKALTGFDIPKHKLSSDLKSAQENWDELDLNKTDFGKIRSKFFGELTSLQGGYTYTGGVLEVTGSKQEQNMIRVYNAFINAGFTARQAAILTAEVGRENSFNSSTMYGSHVDPHKKELLNGGIISFNGSRKIELDKEMMALGLVQKGSIGKASYVESQASLDTMAKFIKKELMTVAEYRNSWNALNSNMTNDQIHYVVGKEYIKWRIDDSKFSATGIENRSLFADKLNQVMEKQHKAQFVADNGNVDLSQLAFTNSNPKLFNALKDTGLKGRVLGDGLVDNKFIMETGLKIKKPKGNEDQAVGGGQSRGYTVEFAHLTQHNLNSKIRYFAGFNDEYHVKQGSTGKHVSGQAFDLVLNDSKDASNVVKQLQAIAKENGYNIKIENEYEKKSRDFTGAHLHVSVLGRNAGGNKIFDQLDAQSNTYQAQLNKANKIQGQSIKSVNPVIGDNLHGRGGNKPFNINVIHEENAKEKISAFNSTTKDKFGVSVKSGVGEEVVVDVVDLKKALKSAAPNSTQAADNSVPMTGVAAVKSISSVVAGEVGRAAANAEYVASRITKPDQNKIVELNNINDENEKNVKKVTLDIIKNENDRRVQFIRNEFNQKPENINQAPSTSLVVAQYRAKDGENNDEKIKLNGDVPKITALNQYLTKYTNEATKD